MSDSANDMMTTYMRLRGHFAKFRDPSIIDLLCDVLDHVESLDISPEEIVAATRVARKNPHLYRLLGDLVYVASGMIEPAATEKSESVEHDYWTTEVTRPG
jgi:hypothetical protein